MTPKMSKSNDSTYKRLLIRKHFLNRWDLQLENIAPTTQVLLSLAPIYVRCTRPGGVPEPCLSHSSSQQHLLSTQGPLVFAGDGVSCQHQEDSVQPGPWMPCAGCDLHQFLLCWCTQSFTLGFSLGSLLPLIPLYFGPSFVST